MIFVFLWIVLFETRLKLSLGIDFYFPLVVSCPPPRVVRLIIERLGLNFNNFYLKLRGALCKTFFWVQAFTIALFLDLSPLGPCSFWILLLPHSPPLMAAWAEFGFKACQRVCVCDEGHCPLGLGFCFFRNCFNFEGFPPFSFAFPLLRFLDGLLARQ
jgi:hypothetical protein